MATTFYFNNKQVTLPGAYSTIKSGERSAARSLDYGRLLVIDTGVFGAGYGGGAGISGQQASGQKAIYSFSTLSEFQSFVKGGMWWKMAEGLFFPDPNNPAAEGISELYYVRAATTTSARMTFTATGGGENGGTFAVFTKDEGVNANGVKVGNILSQGYGYTLEVSPDNENMWVMKFWVGTYTGTAADGISYGEVDQANATPTLILQSPEFDNIATLIEWAKTDTNFGLRFVLDADSSKVTGTGEVTSADVNITDPATYILATGGTETYNSTDIDLVLEQITNLDYNAICTDQYGENANSSVTRKILRHINNVSQFRRFLWIGGYGTEAEFDQSLVLAKTFNSEFVQLVHGDVGLASDFSAEGYRKWTVMYNMCAILGRTLGKPPYIPVTNKSIGVDILVHIPSDAQQKKALQAGVLLTVPNPNIGRNVVLQGINTLQDNKTLFNGNGQSFSIQFMRIVEQINRELVYNAEVELLGDENGVNINTLSPGILQQWTKSYLQSRVATETQDNLILDFENITVTRQEDAYFVSYYIRVNSEITKIFFTGFILR